MVRMELNEQEAVMLSEILQSYLSDLRTEIVDTENKEWRADMKEREDFCKSLVARLSHHQDAGCPNG